MNIETNDLKRWLKANGKNRNWLANECNVAKQTVDGWFTRKALPPMALPIISRLMADANVAVLKFTFDEWKSIMSTMEKSGYTDYQEFAVDVIKNHTQEESPNSKLPPDATPYEQLEEPTTQLFDWPCRAVAAGEAISGDQYTVRLEGEWEEGYAAFKVFGDSMHPVLKDGQIIKCMTYERIQKRNPYPKKGEIYVFDLNGELNIKRYNTREASQEDLKQHPDWTYKAKSGQKRVKVLQSVNEDYEEILLNPQEELRIAAWYQA